MSQCTKSPAFHQFYFWPFSILMHGLDPPTEAQRWRKDGSWKRLAPEIVFVDVGAFLIQHRLQRAERVRVEIEWNPREEVMDQVEVLKHVEPIHDRLHDLALHPEHV